MGSQWRVRNAFHRVPYQVLPDSLVALQHAPVQEAEQHPAAVGSDLAAAAVLEVGLDRSSDHPDQVEILAAAVASSQVAPSSEP
jgi:hypothetical protein